MSGWKEIEWFEDEQTISCDDFPIKIYFPQLQKDLNMIRKWNSVAFNSVWFNRLDLLSVKYISKRNGLCYSIMAYYYLYLSFQKCYLIISRISILSVFFVGFQNLFDPIR